MWSDFVIMNNLRKAQEVSYDERERGCTIFLSLHALGLVIILCIIYWWWPWNIHVMLMKHIFLCIKEKIKSRWSVYQQFIYSSIGILDNLMLKSCCRLTWICTQTRIIVKLLRYHCSLLGWWFISWAFLSQCLSLPKGINIYNKN